MKSATRDFIQLILFCFEILSAFTGVLVWKKIKDKRVHSFILYLFFIVCGELLSIYLRTQKQTNLNTKMFDLIIIPTEFLFGIWFFYSYMGRKWRNICVVFSIAIIGVHLLETSIFKGQKFLFSSLSYIVSTLLLLIILLLFFLQFVKSREMLQFDKHFVFWAAIGMFLYYLITFPLFGLYYYLYNTNKALFYVYWQLQMYLNMLMYFLFAAGLLWTNLKYNSV